MIRAKGIVTVVKRNAETGEVVGEFTESNVITLAKLRFDIQNAGTSTVRLYASTRARIPGVEVNSYHRNAERIRADDIGGTPRFEFTAAAPPDPAFWTVSGRISPPGAGSRFVTGAFLSPNFSGTSNDPENTLAYVTFNTPCEQTDTEILDIFYRIIMEEDFSPNPGVVSWAWEDRIDKWWFQTSGPGAFGNVPAYPNDVRFSWSPNLSEQRQALGAVAFGETEASDSESIDDFVRFIDYDFAIGEEVGQLFGKAEIGYEYPMAQVQILRPGDSPIQSLFGKAPGSTRPFLDASFPANGTGVVNLDGSAWTDPDLPHHYRIDITTGGDVGVAEYKLRRRRTVGYRENTWRSHMVFLDSVKKQIGSTTIIGSQNSETKGGGPEPHGQTTQDTSGTDSMAQFFFDEYYLPGFGLHRYLGTDQDAFEFITYDFTGITVVDFAKDTFFNVDALTSPALPVTDISQVANETDGTIWVADRASGLYRIDRAGIRQPVTAVTLMSVPGVTDTQCYGVEVSPVTGDIWAVFEGGLAQSTDGGTSWTVYNEVSDPQFNPVGGNWARYHTIWIDPVSVEDRLVLSAPGTFNTSNNGTLVMWSRANSSPTSDQVTVSSVYSDGTAYRLLGKRYGFFSNDGRFYAHDNSNAHNLVVFDWQTPAPVFETSSQDPTVVLGLIFVKDEFGNDLILGEETVSGQNNIVARDFSQLGTTSFTLRMESVENTGTYRSISDSARVNSAVMDLGRGLYIWYGTSGHQETGAYPNQVNGYSLSMWGQFDEPLAGDTEHLVWEEYGWDGGNWVLGNPNSKLTHAGAEALLDGITISFTDNAPSPSFVQDDYYVWGVYDGILKDDATTFDYEAFIPFTAAEIGTDFSPSTVPAVDTGSVLNDPVHFRSNAEGDLFYGPGQVCDRNGSSNHAQSEQQMEGDFEVRFKFDHLTGFSGATAGTGIAIIDFPTSYSTTNVVANSAHQHSMFFSDEGDISGALQQIRIYEGGVLVHTEALPNAFDDRATDVWSINRTGTTIEYRRNGTPFYTSGNASSGAKRVKYVQTSDAGCPSDVEIDYEANKRLVALGDNITTGRANPDFRHVPLSLADSQFEIFLDGVPAVILTDGFTAPAPGEVQLLRQGRLWFNSADAGKAITGNWITLLKLNLA